LSFFYFSYKAEFPKTVKIIGVIFLIAIILFPVAIIVTLFVPEIGNTDTNQYISYLLILIGISLIYFYRVQPKLRVYLVFILLVASRIAMNNIYLPNYKSDSRTTYYKNIVEDIIAITDEKTLHMSGELHRYNSNIQFGKTQLITSGVKTAPVLAFQIPYYFTIQTGEIILYEEKM
jgi:hypothetical protein